MQSETDFNLTVQYHTNQWKFIQILLGIDKFNLNNLRQAILKPQQFL